MSGYLRGDVLPVHGGEAGDAEQHLPRPLRRHVRHHGGEDDDDDHDDDDDLNDDDDDDAGQHPGADLGGPADEDPARDEGEPPGPGHHHQGERVFPSILFHGVFV